MNPMAMFLTTRLMLEWLGEMEMAIKLEKSIATVILEKKVKTYDMGGNNTSLEVAGEVSKRL